jgi:hypothetical protein
MQLRGFETDVSDGLGGDRSYEVPMTMLKKPRYSQNREHLDLSEYWLSLVQRIKEVRTCIKEKLVAASRKFSFLDDNSQNWYIS